MALLLQTYSINKVKLNFYSFTDPLDRKLWLTGIDFARDLGFKNPKEVINYFVLRNRPDSYIKWSQLINSKDLRDLHLYPTKKHELPKNWNLETLMVDQSFVSMMLLVSNLPCAIEIKQHLCKVVFNKIRNDGAFGSSHSHIQCLTCQKKHYETIESLHKVETILKLTKQRLAKYQKKLDVVQQQIHALESPIKITMDIQEIYV